MLSLAFRGNILLQLNDKYHLAISPGYRMASPTSYSANDERKPNRFNVDPVHQMPELNMQTGNALIFQVAKSVPAHQQFDPSAKEQTETRLLLSPPRALSATAAPKGQPTRLISFGISAHRAMLALARNPNANWACFCIEQW